MLTLLTGAKKNIGDFLIAAKSKEIITKITGEKEFLEINRWNPMDKVLDKVNATKAVIICGGPAYGKKFYPEIIPLTTNLNDIKVPIIPIGVGVEGMNPKDLDSFGFTAKSLEALEFIHSTCNFSGVRDSLTLSILKKHGIGNVRITGCPVIYDFESFSRSFRIPEQIIKIVITPPANRDLYFQCLHLSKLMRKSFPDAEIVASFHRGLQKDCYTTLRSSLALKAMVLMLRKYGINSIDTSYDLDKIKFYRDCDLHVGYRVHAHVYFNSMRKASFLLQEDTRGVGMSEVLGLSKSDAYAYDADSINKIFEGIKQIQNGKLLYFCEIDKVVSNCYLEMEKVLTQIK